MQMNVNKGLPVVVSSGNEEGIQNLATSWCYRRCTAPQDSVSEVTTDPPRWFETCSLPHEGAALGVFGQAPR
jgi:hypothetical protein